MKFKTKIYFEMKKLILKTKLETQIYFELKFEVKKKQNFPKPREKTVKCVRR